MYLCNMDLLLTLGLIYLAYRGYRWYSGLQNQVQAGDSYPENDPIQKGREEDYIDYEEVE